MDRGPVIHDLKCEPMSFERLLDGTKTFEIRRDDRGYQLGDVLRLREWNPGMVVHQLHDGYTGRVEMREVGFVFRQGYGVDLGEFVVMALLHPTTRAEVGA